MNRAIKIILAPCSFKGSLSASEVCKHLENGINKALPTKSFEIIKIPLADGGEGLVECLLTSTSGKLVNLKAKDPLYREIETFYGVTPDKVAIIEMASASGLPLLQKSERNPLITTTFGTGELIKHALDSGCRKFIIGLGGSATVDCGHGMAKALGVKFLDNEGKEIHELGGGCLNKIQSIDLTNFDSRIKECEFTAACDVTNPLCGKTGASYVFGPQKGATPEMVETLDNNLLHFGELLEKVFNKEIVNKVGSGAAGGMGAVLFSFLNAEFKKGIDIVKEASKFDEHAKGADLIITGEGGLDSQTLGGKALSGMLESAIRLRAPIVAIAGKLDDDEDIFYNAGFKSVFSIVNRPMTEEEAMKNAGELIQKTGQRIVRLYFNVENKNEI